MKTGIRFLSIIVLSMLTSSVFAQQGQGQRVQRTPEQTAKTTVEWMKTELKLNEATEKKVYDVVLKYAKKCRRPRQGESLHERVLEAPPGMRPRHAQIGRASCRERV